jgi:hypothetical protein
VNERAQIELLRCCNGACDLGLRCSCSDLLERTAGGALTWWYSICFSQGRDHARSSALEAAKSVHAQETFSQCVSSIMKALNLPLLSCQWKASESRHSITLGIERKTDKAINEKAPLRRLNEPQTY